MVSVTIDNTPVSVTLGDGESVSVPTGETWSVDINVGSDEAAKINGKGVAGTTTYDTNAEIQTVLTEGDSVASASSSAYDGVHIGGWVVA